MGLAEKIKEFRLQRGLQVHEAAKLASLSIDYWYKLEAGERTPSVKTLEKKVAPALRRKPSDFFAS